MKKTVIKINKMDCPSEVKLIERAFENVDQEIKIDFNLENRTASFYHKISSSDLLKTLMQISLPGELIESSDINENDVPELGTNVEAKTLKYLLFINFVMFIVEVALGIYAQSTGLLADGLDMLADSFVYGLSLYAIGKTLAMKNRAAFLSGVMQITLGTLCLAEVGRKFYFGSEPLSSYMISISLLALLANLICLMLIHKHKDGEVHMKASWIFSANDVIVNLGVILSGALVHFMNSNIPDLIIGIIVAVIVIRGGITIIKMSNMGSNKGPKGTGSAGSCCNT